MPAPVSLADAWCDLVLGGRCSGCARPGRVLCPGCAASLPCAVRPAWPLPTPEGLAPPWCAAEYAGTVRRMLIDHKEGGRLGLVKPLGGLLAPAAVAAAGGPGLDAGTTIVLVPTPSRSAVVRARRHDPVLRMTRVAAGRLRAEHDVRVEALPVLRFSRSVRDQAGLGAAARAENLRDALSARPAPAARVRALLGAAAARVVLVDDVITTGVTLREGQRALEAVGLRVSGLATVAATRRLRDPAFR